MMNETHEAHSASCRGPLEHLLLAVRVAEGKDGATADVLIDADGLAGFVVNEVQLGQFDEQGLAVRSSKLVLPLLPTTCSGGMP